MNHDDERVALMEDVNAWVERALIRQFRVAYSDELPALTPEVQDRLAAAASTFASGRLAERDAGYGMFNPRRAYVHGPRDGRYRLSRAVSRASATALCALSGSNGR
jgi:hypothetical protein